MPASEAEEVEAEAEVEGEEEDEDEDEDEDEEVLVGVATCIGRLPSLCAFRITWWEPSQTYLDSAICPNTEDTVL